MGKNILKAMNDDELDMVSGGTIIPYVAQAGDSKKSIADKFNVTVEQLDKWNNLTGSDIIQVGQQLKIKY